MTHVELVSFFFFFFSQDEIEKFSSIQNTGREIFEQFTWKEFELKNYKAKLCILAVDNQFGIIKYTWVILLWIFQFCIWWIKRIFIQHCLKTTWLLEVEYLPIQFLKQRIQMRGPPVPLYLFYFLSTHPIVHFHKEGSKSV